MNYIATDLEQLKGIVSIVMEKYRDRKLKSLEVSYCVVAKPLPVVDGSNLYENKPTLKIEFYE